MALNGSASLIETLKEIHGVFVETVENLGNFIDALEDLNFRVDSGISIEVLEN